MKYRVNFGNGQVSQRFASRKAAFAYLEACRREGSDPYSGHYFVEVRDADGWWTRAREVRS